jgi:hypothetical protein
MIKASIRLQELRRKIYIKAKADKQWRFWGLYCHIMRRQKRRGFGWKRWSREELYQRWGLYRDYRIRYLYPKAAPAR